MQKFANMKNELEVKQNSELSKLQVQSNKAMTKLSSVQGKASSTQGGKQPLLASHSRLR